MRILLHRQKWWNNLRFMNLEDLLHLLLYNLLFDKLLIALSAYAIITMLTMLMLTIMPLFLFAPYYKLMILF